VQHIFDVMYDRTMKKHKSSYATGVDIDLSFWPGALEAVKQLGMIVPQLIQSNGTLRLALDQHRKHDLIWAGGAFRGQLELD
jgi:hypothetical protein